MNVRRSALWTTPLVALGLAGCQGVGSQSCYPPGPPPPARGAVILPAHPLTPCQACPVRPAPAAAFLDAPVCPPGGPIRQAGGVALPPGVQLGGPVPVGPGGSRDSARLGAPESPEPPKAPPADKPAAPEREPSPKLPVGIANFAEAEPGVSTGLRPMLDGVTWLKSNGYRAVLQLREPGESADGDRKLMEQRGLKYLSLEVSPKALKPALVEEFNKAVAAADDRPLFVYDRDGALAGALWYLHFRTAEKLSDEEARKKAAPLGLRVDAAGPQAELWLAIQKYVEDNLK